MSVPERPRLFVAVELPPDVRAAIDEVSKPWRAKLDGFTWSLPENLHLTLAFLGQVDPDQLDEIRTRLATTAAAIAPFSTRLTHLGRFPLKARARVLWVGLDDADARLTGLAAAVGESLDGLVEREDRVFSAHVTIARAHRSAGVPDEVIAVELLPVRVAVGEIALFRSHLGGGPPRYEVLARWALGAGAAEVP